MNNRLNAFSSFISARGAVNKMMSLLVDVLFLFIDDPKYFSILSVHVRIKSVVEMEHFCVLHVVKLGAGIAVRLCSELPASVGH